MARPAPREYEEHEVLSRAQIADQAHYEVDCDVKQYQGDLKIEVEWR